MYLIFLYLFGKSADGRYCMRVHHAKAALLLDLVDEAWAKDTLPDDRTVPHHVAFCFLPPSVLFSFCS
jgi:hypothetical protein